MTPRGDSGPARFWRGAAGVVATLALMLASAAILRARDRRMPLATSSDRWLYVRSPAVGRLLAMNYSAVVADSYWLRTIQHFGGDRITHRDDAPFALLSPLLDLTTALDPKFTVAYRFGAIFLSEPPPGGPGRPDQAIALLERGLRVSPNRWQYAQDIAFVHLWHENPQAAAMWFRRAGAMPGAPNWLDPVAATVMMSGGDRRAARSWLEDMQANASEEWIRTIAERRISQLTALDQIDQLQAMVPLFQERMHRNPTGWEDFQAAGLLRGLPTDPSGAPYVYFPASGRVRLQPDSPLAPLPDLPGSRR
jgi:hypothetical protein